MTYAKAMQNLTCDYCNDKILAGQEVCIPRTDKTLVCCGDGCAQEIDDGNEESAYDMMMLAEDYPD